MPFLFTDLILFCISMSPLQIQILDKPIHFFLQTAVVAPVVSAADTRNTIVIVKNAPKLNTGL